MPSDMESKFSRKATSVILGLVLLTGIYIPFTPSFSDTGATENFTVTTFEATSTFSSAAGIEGIAIDSLGNWVVADTGNNRVLGFNAEGEPLFVITTFASSPNTFSTPLGVGIDPFNDDFFVADFVNDRIVQFDSSGNFIAAINNFDAGSKTFDGPHDVFVDGTELLVADLINNRIVRFSITAPRTASLILSSFNGGDTFEDIQSVEVDSTGRILVADNVVGGERILIFPSTIINGGTSSEEITHFDTTDTFGFIDDIVVGSVDEIYVIDSDVDELIVLPSGITNASSSTTIRTSFSSDGGITFSNDTPTALAFTLFEGLPHVFIANAGFTSNPLILVVDSTFVLVQELIQFPLPGPSVNSFFTNSLDSVAIFPNGDIVATDGTAEIFIFDNEGNFIRDIKKFHGNDGFSGAIGTTIDSSGNLIVTDGNSVLTFDEDGVLQGDFNVVGSTTLVDVATNSNNQIWVTDTGGGSERVLQFSPTGVLLQTIISCGTGNCFQAVRGIDVDSFDDVVLVVDVGGTTPRIIVLSDTGNHIFTIETFGAGQTFSNLFDIAIDDVTGDIFVPDATDNVVYQFNFNGNLIETIIGIDTDFDPSTAEDFFSGPKAVAVGSLVVADTGNDRLVSLAFGSTGGGGGASGDVDGDGTINSDDNCVFQPNADQADFDSDGVGDVCDADFPGNEGLPDSDADGILDNSDNCTFTPNPDQEDLDNNLVGDVCEFFGFNNIMQETANPPHLVIDPSGTATTTVTIQKTDDVRDPVSFEIFPNIQGCTITALDPDNSNAPFPTVFGEQQFSFGSNTIITAIASFSCSGAAPGDYVSFFDVIDDTGQGTFLDIFVTIADSSIPLITLSPQGLEPGNSTKVDVFNFPPGLLVGFTITGPGEAGTSLTVTACPIVDSVGSASNPITDTAGRLQCFVTVPSTITTFGQFIITAAGGTTSASETISVFQAGTGSFTLSVNPVDLLLPDPPAPLVSLTIADIIENATISYSALGTFTDSVDVEIIGLPFGVESFLSVDGAAFGPTTTTATLTNSSSKITATFLPTPSAPIGFFSVTVQAIATSDPANAQFESIGLLIPPPSEFFDFAGGGFNFGVLGITPSSAIQGDIVSFSGFVPAEFVGDEVELFIEFDEIATLPPTITVTNNTATGQGEFTGQFEVPSSLPVTGISNPFGFFEVEAEIIPLDLSFGPVFFADLNIISADATFILSVPDFLSPVEIGTSSDTATITVNVLSGKDLSDCAITGTVDVVMFGMPPGVTAALDPTDKTDIPPSGSTEYEVLPEVSLAISPGGFNSTNLFFAADASAFPGPFEAFVEVFCSTTDFQELPIFSGVLGDSAFFDFGDGLAAGAYNPFTISTVFMNPSAVTPGEQVSITASGFTASEFVGIEIISFDFGGGFFEFSQAQANLPTTAVFDSSGQWTGSIAIPSDLSKGFFELEVFDESGRFGFTEFTVLGANDVFSMTTSSSFLGAVQQGTTSSEITISLKALPGKDAGTITLELFGIPPGVTVFFDGVAATGFPPSTTASLGIGSSETIKLKYVVDGAAPLGPVFGDLFATSNKAPTQFFVFVDFDIVPGGDFFDASFFGSFGFGAFNPFSYGFLTVNPFAAQAGDSLTIFASGFKPGDVVADLTLGVDLLQIPFNIPLPGGTSFDSTGSLSLTITVPDICTQNQLDTFDTSCLPDAGFYPVKISDTTGNNVGHTDFELLGTGATITLSASPQFIPPLSQGQSADAIFDVSDAETKITVKALSGQDPGLTTLTLGGVPPFVTVFVSTDDGTTFSSVSDPASLLATVTPPTGGKSIILLDFAIDVSAPPTFFPMFLGADPTTGDNAELPMDFGIIPSTTFLDLFNIANVFVNPPAGTFDDQIDIIMSGFNPTQGVTINFAGTTLCTADNPDCTDDNLPNSAVFDSSGFLSLTITVPSLNLGIHPVTVTDELGRTATGLFELTIGDFTMSVSPDFLEPFAQGTTSNEIAINIEALLGKKPGDVFLSVSGLPPGVDVVFDGVSVGGDTIELNLGFGERLTTIVTLVADETVPPGFYIAYIEAICTTSFQFIELPVFILPGGVLIDTFESLTVIPDFGEIGDHLTIKGSGFTGGNAVSLTFGGASAIPTGVTFESDGTVSFPITIPTGFIPGLYPVTLSDGSSNEDTVLVEVVSSGTTFVIDVSPLYLEPVVQGSTTNVIQVSVKPPPGKLPPNVTISVDGLPPGASILFDDVAATSKIVDGIALGITNSTEIKIVTTATTPPGFFDVFVIAEGGGFFSVVPVGVSISPDFGEGAAFATISIQPSTVAPGEVITLAGIGYSPNTSFSTLDIFVPGDPTPITIEIGDTIGVDVNGDWSTLIEVPSGTPAGKYILSVSAGSRAADAGLTIIPETDSFFDIGISPDFLKVTQGTNVATSTVNTTLTVKSSNGFAETLELVMSDLPLGMGIKLTNSSGTVLATFTGALSGNTATATPTLIGGSEIIPGKSTVITVTVGTDDSTPVGTYQVFLGAEGTNDARSKPIGIQVLPAVGAALSVSPQTGVGLSKASISGSGFNAGTITVEFAGLSPGILGFTTEPTTLTASSDFAGLITVPNLAAGTYSIRASDGTNEAFTQYQILPTTQDTFGLQISPKQALIQQGSTATQTVTITPLGSFTDNITISVTGLPTGVTITSFEPSPTITPVPGIPTPVTIEYAAAGGATLGVGLYDVTGTATTVTVVEPAAINVLALDSLTFLLGPDEIALEKDGDGAIINLVVVAVGNPGNPTISVSGLATGIIVNGSAALSNIEIDTNTKLGFVFLNITATSAADIGPTTFTVTAVPGSTETIFVTVLEDIIDEADIPVFDPSTVSGTTPLQVLPDYPDDVNPKFIFDSIVSGQGATTVDIYATKTLKDADTLADLPSGFPFGSEHIFNIDIAGGVSDLDVTICLPRDAMPSGTVATTVMFFNETADWETVPSSTQGSFICSTDTVDHTSGWGLGGVKALFLGGSVGPDRYPPILTGFKIYEENEYPFTINGKGYELTSLATPISTYVIETGELTEFKILAFENKGPAGLTHMGFLTNLRGLENQNWNSDTWIIWDKDEPLDINDPHGYFADVNVTKSEVGGKAEFTFDITFAKPMETSDIIIKMWDKNRNGRDTSILNAIQVIGDEILVKEPPAEMESQIAVPDWVRNNAKWWSEGTIDDSDFASGIQFLIKEKIIVIPDLPESGEATGDAVPDWVKSNAGWWADGLLSDQEFVNGTQWLIENGIIRI